MAKALQTQHLKQKQKRGLVLVDFGGNLVGPCRMQAPILEKLSEELSEDELKILKMDVDENPGNSACFRHYVPFNLAL